MTPALSFGKIYDSQFPETVYIPGGRMGRRIGEIVICLPDPNDPRRSHLGSVRFWDSASKALGQGRRRPTDTSDTSAIIFEDLYRLAGIHRYIFCFGDNSLGNRDITRRELTRRNRLSSERVNNSPTIDYN